MQSRNKNINPRGGEVGSKRRGSAQHQAMMDKLFGNDSDSLNPKFGNYAKAREGTGEIKPSRVQSTRMDRRNLPNGGIPLIVLSDDDGEEDHNKWQKDVHRHRQTKKNEHMTNKGFLSQQVKNQPQKTHEGGKVKPSREPLAHRKLPNAGIPLVQLSDSDDSEDGFNFFDKYSREASGVSSINNTPKWQIYSQLHRPPKKDEHMTNVHSLRQQPKNYVNAQKSYLKLSEFREPSKKSGWCDVKPIEPTMKQQMKPAEIYTIGPNVHKPMSHIVPGEAEKRAKQAVIDELRKQLAEAKLALKSVSDKPADDQEIGGSSSTDDGVLERRDKSGLVMWAKKRLRKLSKAFH